MNAPIPALPLCVVHVPAPTGVTTFEAFFISEQHALYTPT